VACKHSTQQASSIRQGLAVVAALCSPWHHTCAFTPFTAHPIEAVALQRTEPSGWSNGGSLGQTDCCALHCTRQYRTVEAVRYLTV
jgi:hypothetical protein